MSPNDVMAVIRDHTKIRWDGLYVCTCQQGGRMDGAAHLYHVATAISVAQAEHVRAKAQARANQLAAVRPVVHVAGIELGLEHYGHEIRLPNPEGDDLIGKLLSADVEAFGPGTSTIVELEVQGVSRLTTVGADTFVSVLA